MTSTGAEPRRGGWPPWWGFVALAFLAFVQVMGSIRAAENQPHTPRAVDAAAVVLLLVGPLALIALRRAPVAVVWTVATVTVVYLSAGYPYGPVFVSAVVASFGCVLTGHRVAAWAAMAALYVGMFTASPLLRDEPWEWGSPAAAGAWVLLILVVADVVRARRERAGQARLVQAETARRQAGEERLRIARELHDVVAHHMSLINVQAGVALHLVDRKPEQAQTALRAIKDASKEALGELRALVGVLRDETEAAPRAPVSMLDSLDGLVERAGHAGLRVTPSVEGTVRALPAAVSLAAFRIVQEAITNVVRHSGARSADVRLDYGADVLRVRVDDDGTGGAAASRFAAGSGLRGMRERATALGGSLDVGAAPAGGVRVEAVLPVGADQGAAP